MTGSALQVSLVFILTELPSFLGFLSGAIRRYFSPRKLIVCYDLIRFFILLLLATMQIGGVNSTYLIFACFFAINVFSTLFRPTRIEFVTHLVEDNQLKKFISLDQTFEAVAMAFGLGLGGYAYHYLSMEWIFLLDAMTFLISGISILLLKSTPTVCHNTDDGQNIPTSFWETIVSVSNHRGISFLVYGEALAGVVFGIFLSMFVVYAKQYLFVNSIIIGHMEMVQAFLAIYAGLCIAFGFVKLSERTLGVSGYLGMAVSMICIGLTSSALLVYFFIAVIGFFNMMYSIAIRTLLQTSVPRNKVIHVFALESILSRSASIIGAVVAGSFISIFSVKENWVIFLPGIILSVVSLWGYFVLFNKEANFINSKKGGQNV